MNNSISKMVRLLMCIVGISYGQARVFASNLDDIGMPSEGKQSRGNAFKSDQYFFTMYTESNGTEQAFAIHEDIVKAYPNTSHFDEEILKRIADDTTSLTTLNLSGYGLTTLPDMSNFMDLVYLNLENNNFSKLPNSLKSLPSLKFLNLKGNPICKKYPLRILKVILPDCCIYYDAEKR